MVVDQLLPDLLLHAGERVVGAGQVAGQVGKSLLHQVLHAQPLVLGDAGGQAESVNVAPDPAQEEFKKKLLEEILALLYINCCSFNIFKNSGLLAKS